MIQKRNVFIIILSLLIVSTFSQLIVPGYFYSSNYDNYEREILNMQEEVPISVGPPTLDDILPKERDLSIFMGLLKKFEDTVSRISRICLEVYKRKGNFVFNDRFFFFF